MDVIEEQNGTKRRRCLIYTSECKGQDYEMVYEGVVLRYEEDSERFMEYR